MSEPRKKPDPASVEAGYELHDVSARWLVLFAAVLAAMVVVVCLFLIWLVGLFEAQAAKHDPLLSPLAEDQTPPATSPLLQANPKIDFAEKRAREDTVLSEYRWLDEERKTLRIPIDEAMRIIEREGVRPRVRPNKPDEPPTDEQESDKNTSDASSENQEEEAQ